MGRLDPPHPLTSHILPNVIPQVLNRLTYAASLSHLRRLNTPLGREGKQAKPRQLHNSHWGMVRACSTNTRLAGQGRPAGRGSVCHTGSGLATTTNPPTPPNKQVCPAETPEGHAVGLVKNLALMAYISKDSPSLPILEVLTEYGTEGLDETLPSEIALPTVTRIFCNGALLGCGLNVDGEGALE